MHYVNIIPYGFDTKTSTFSGQFEGSSLDNVDKRTSLPNDEAVSSSNQEEQYLWVDDYKCLLCGVELPPSFVEERQEHSDFHLAERLQKEESSNLRNLTPKQRYHNFLAICLNV